MRGPAVLIVPVDIAMADMHDTTPFSVQVNHPIVRPSDAELELAARASSTRARRPSSTAGRLRGRALPRWLRCRGPQGPVAYTSRGKDFLQPDNPHGIGLTGLLGNEAAYHAVMASDTFAAAGRRLRLAAVLPGPRQIVQVDIEPTTSASAIRSRSA